MLDTRPLLLNPKPEEAGPQPRASFPAIRRSSVETLQVNLGYLCNLSCTHCHVNAGPTRTELMDRRTVDQVLDYLRSNRISTLDLTGGAPEMNPHFRYLVREARRAGAEVIDRCNLTILGEPGHEDLAAFLAEQQVIVTASLPCYQEQNVDRQRGKGVYRESIAALQKLNELGFGIGPELQLNLVYNPDGLNLPPDQLELETAYKKELRAEHGIEFNQLFTITNMPISRFGGMLLAKGIYNEYMEILHANYQPGNVETVMCRELLSIDYRGYVYDCDFNQMLDYPLQPWPGHGVKAASTIASDRPRVHLSELNERDLAGHPIAVAEHCFGCTAGQGSSCGGALSD